MMTPSSTSQSSLEESVGIIVSSFGQQMQVVTLLKITGSLGTGTPPGVGLGMKPEPQFLKIGDVVRLGIAGLGEQRQRIVKFKM